MAKKTITALLVMILLVLVLIAIATKQFAKPEQKLVGKPIEAKTPRAQEPIRDKTPKAEETPLVKPGVKAELVYPSQANFWVNELRVAETYGENNFIPLRQSSVKTFAGSFGPYPEAPKNLKTVLCAELYKIPAAPSCETVETIYRQNYVSFAKGYVYDEYIGGMAAKDYIAYYDVYLGETRVASSNRAVIRTVKG